MTACVTKQHVGDLITLTCDRTDVDEDPIYFLQRIMGLGGAEGLAFVTALVDDPKPRKEATTLMKRAQEKSGQRR